MNSTDPSSGVGRVFSPEDNEFRCKQAQEKQKMEALGQLAGGMACNFNDALTVVTGYSQLLLDSGQLPAEVAEQLRQIYAAGTRAGNLMRQLMLFSGEHVVNKQVIDLNNHITGLARVLGRIVDEPIRLELSLAPVLPAINADAAMLEQILMNLAFNARDAMPNGGVLAIITAKTVLSEAEVTGHPGRRPGEYICLTVSDNGCGIPPENISRIFEPFYTTKKPGMGMGLGLATVFGIVKAHAGWIEVESQLDVGTRFRVFLPSAPDQLQSTGKAGATSGGKKTETILLVEDEMIVRDFIVAVLSRHGYRVLQAGSGVDALEVWKWYSSRIVLLLTDMVLPDDVSGLQLAEELQKTKPALKVVLMSGYTSQMVGQLHTRGRQVRFIQKPIRPDALARIVREALEAEPVEKLIS